MERTLETGETPVDMVLRHERELHRSNGKEGLFTRMHSQEEKTDRLDKRTNRIVAMGWAIILLLLATLFTAIADYNKASSQSQQHSNIETF